MFCVMVLRSVSAPETMLLDAYHRCGIVSRHCHAQVEDAST